MGKQLYKLRLLQEDGSWKLVYVYGEEAELSAWVAAHTMSLCDCHGRFFVEPSLCGPDPHMFIVTVIGDTKDKCDCPVECLSKRSESNRITCYVLADSIPHVYELMPTFLPGSRIVNISDDVEASYLPLSGSASQVTTPSTVPSSPAEAKISTVFVTCPTCGLESYLICLSCQKSRWLTIKGETAVCKCGSVTQVANCACGTAIDGKFFKNETNNDNLKWAARRVPQSRPRKTAQNSRAFDLEANPNDLAAGLGILLVVIGVLLLVVAVVMMFHSDFVDSEITRDRQVLDSRLFRGKVQGWMLGFGFMMAMVGGALTRLKGRGT